MSSWWQPIYKDCTAYGPTEEGMSEFTRKFRDLPYCKNEGSKDSCGRCAAHRNSGFGGGVKPTIRFTKGYACPI